MDDGHNDTLAAAELMKAILQDDEQGSVLNISGGKCLEAYLELYRRCYRVVCQERRKERRDS